MATDLVDRAELVELHSGDLVLCLRESVLRWFDLQANDERSIAADGVVRASSFPGLWIHSKALLAKNYAELIATLQAGLATVEHAKFVQRLADAHKPA